MSLKKRLDSLEAGKKKGEVRFVINSDPPPSDLDGKIFRIYIRVPGNLKITD